MRIVLDTNVLVAAFISHGTCAEVIEHCAVNHEIMLSPAIQNEFVRVLIEKFGFDQRVAGAANRLLRGRCQMVSPVPLAERVCRDADDDMVLATAVAGACDCIITGDRDLLDLESFQGMAIVSPDAFWSFERER